MGIALDYSLMATVCQAGCRGIATGFSFFMPEMGGGFGLGLSGMG